MQYRSVLHLLSITMQQTCNNLTEDDVLMNSADLKLVRLG